MRVVVRQGFYCISVKRGWVGVQFRGETLCNTWMFPKQAQHIIATLNFGFKLGAVVFWKQTTRSVCVLLPG